MSDIQQRAALLPVSGSHQDLMDFKEKLYLFVVLITSTSLLLAHWDMTVSRPAQHRYADRKIIHSWSSLHAANLRMSVWLGYGMLTAWISMDSFAFPLVPLQ